MTDFIHQNLAGSVFEDVYLTGARFHDVDLAGTDFRQVDLTGARLRDAVLVNVDISGKIGNLRVNGVDVVPLVEAELDSRYPDRPKMRPADADGFREAWEILERLWQQTVARARAMAPELLHDRRASRCAGACRPSSARSGSTGCMPNVTSACCRLGRTDPPPAGRRRS